MVSEPVGQLAAIEPVSGKIEYEALLGIDGGIDLCTVEHQECLHGGVPNALVAIDERVALNQRQAQRRGLVSESGIQVTTTERGLRPRRCAWRWFRATLSSMATSALGTPPWRH